MGWLIKEKRGPAWKRGWTDQTMHSLSLPPMPMVAIFCIVAFLLYLSFSFNYNKQVERTMVGMKLFLLLIPLLLLLWARWVAINRRLIIPQPSDPEHQGGGSPWGVALLVLLLLVLLSHQPSFHSKWFPWHTSY